MPRNGSSWFFGFVESVHRGNESIVNRAFHRFRGTIDCRSNKRLFFLKKSAQHVFNRAFAWRRPNTNAQSRNVLGSESHDDRFEAVVASRATAGSQSKTAKWQGKIVEHNENFPRLDFEKLSELGERFSATIDVSHRFHQDQFSRFRHKRVLLGGFFPCRRKMNGKPIDDKKANVMARVIVFRPGVSETGNQTNLWSFFFHIRSAENQISQKLSSGVDQDRSDANSLLLLLFFPWDRRGRCLFSFFLFLADHLRSGYSFRFSHNWFFFDCWGENRKCREIGRHLARDSGRQLDLPQVNGVPDVQLRNIDGDPIRQ